LDGGPDLPVDGATLSSVLEQASVDVAERPIIVVLRSDGAEISVVIGDPSGTTLVYFPADYAQSGVGSLISVADREAADADRSEPPLVADYFTHWTEFPRWSVIPHSLAERALAEFLGTPSEPPRFITWQPD
jgi:hypothetical protein